MMNNDDPRLRSLLRQADKVAQSGKRAAAEKLYRDIVNEFPNSTMGWLGLAGVVTTPAEKRPIYERVLAMDPANEAAQAGLAALDGGPVAEMAAEPAPVAPSSEDAGFQELQAKLEAAVAKEQTASAIPPTETAEEHVQLFCYRHPQRATSLRCNNCGRPICISCAKRTPVGYRCPQCIKELEDTFFNATPLHYALAVMITLPLAAILGYIAGFVGFFILFLGAAAGGVIGRIVFRLIGRRRGRWLPHTVAAATVIGALLGGSWPMLLAFLLSGSAEFLLAGGSQLIWTGICGIVAAGTAFYWVK